MALSWSNAFSGSREGAPAGGGPSDDVDLMGCSAVDSNCERQDENKTLVRGKQLDAAIWSMLDGHLQEKIISRLPFKSLFQAASLSRTWRQNLCSSHFRSEVVHSSAGSASWESYAPVFVNNKRELVGYESSSKRWCRLPTLSYVTEDAMVQSSAGGDNRKKTDRKSKKVRESYGWRVEDWRFIGGNGCLLCWTCRDLQDPYNVLGHVPVLVTNPLTKSWKLLPPRPDMRDPGMLHVVCEGSKAYKLVLCRYAYSLVNGYTICLQIFDSADSSWTTESHLIRNHIRRNGLICGGGCWGSSTVKNAVLYMLIFGVWGSPDYALVSFDLKKRVWKEIPELRQEFDESQKPHERLTFSEVLFSKLFACGSNAMLVIFHNDWCCGEFTRETLSVFRLDLEAGLALEVSRAPTSMLKRPSNGACHGDCIYLGGSNPSYYSVVYNVATQTWHRLNSPADMLHQVSGCDVRYMANGPCHWQMASVTYQPGLNPFLEV